MTETTRTLPDFTQAPMQPEIGQTCSYPPPPWTPIRRNPQPRKPGLSGRATLLMFGAVLAVVAVVGGGVALANRSKPEPFIRNQDVGAIKAAGGYGTDQATVTVDFGNRRSTDGSDEWASATATWMAGPTETSAKVTFYADGQLSPRIIQINGVNPKTCTVQPGGMTSCSIWVPAKASVHYTATVEPRNT